MRIEESQVRDRMEAARAAGDAAGRRVSALVAEMEALGHFDNRPSDEDLDLCEELLETITNSNHYTEKHTGDSFTRDVFKSAARRFWSPSLPDADRDLRFASTAFMDAHWFDHLEDLAADERAMARA
jgi:hypothetical protein